MRTQGQIEALAGEAVNRFLQHSVGRGASVMTTTLRANVLLVHLQDVLTPAERSLASDACEGRDQGDSIVRAMRDRIVRQSRGELAAALAGIVGQQPTTVRHDVDPATGDEVIAFLFRDGAPARNRRETA